jgi:hypothetical protein
MSNIIAKGISGSLTDTEKEVVRSNIGAVSQADMVIKIDAFANITEMMKVNVSNLIDGQQVSIAGYHEGSTEGGGIFVWSTGRHNGGTFIDPNRTFPADWNDQAQLTAWFADSGSDVAGFARLFEGAVNVKWFGVKGNGVVDDTKSLRKTVDSYNNVYAENCTINITSTIAKNGIFVLTCDNAIFKMTSESTVLFDLSYSTFIDVHGGTFVGNGSDFINSSSSNAIAFLIEGASNVTFTNNTFNYFTYTSCRAFVDPVSHFKFIGNRVTSISDTLNSTDRNNAGIVVKIDIGTIQNNTINKCSQGLIVAEFSKDVIITQNHIHDTYVEHGMYIDTGVSNILISNNIISNAKRNAIKVQHYTDDVSENITVSDNTISTSSVENGILVSVITTTIGYIKNITIKGNTISNVQNGIYCGSQSSKIRNVTVAGNNISTCNAFGMQLFGIEIGAIQNNIINSCGQTGVYESGGSELSIKDNTVISYGLDASISTNYLKSGIFINNANNHTLSGNNTKGDSVKSDYGLYVAGGLTNTTVVQNNICTGSKTTGIRLAGSTSIFALISGNYSVNSLGAYSIAGAPETSIAQLGTEEHSCYSTSIPTSGTWSQGAKVYRRYPTAGGHIGWVCVVGGSPGTWKTFGSVSA